MTKRLPVGIFFALFTLSGFAGLIYQSIWSHYLKLFLGHAAYAQTLVLAIFMGGMAIGSWLVARVSRRIGNLLLGYALAELGIGLFAFAFHPVFRAATAWAFDSVLPALGGHGADAFKWALASVLILPASILLGTTFPLMSAGILRVRPDTGGRALAMLYFTNSFGAAVGVLASGFYLIDRLGLPGTILTAGILNVALALTVWAMVRTHGGEGAAAGDMPQAGATPRAFGRAMLWLAFGTGAASFIYEVTWVRMLSLALGASTHSFEVMLAAFIFGMALGAWWLRDRIAGIRDATPWLAAVLVLKAVFAVYAIWIFGDILEFIAWLMHAVAKTDGGYVINTVGGLAASMAVMFPAAFCAGMTLPLATYALTGRGYGESAIGRVYAANTAGCIVGAIFTTHVGMELLGVKGLTGAGALVDIAVGLLAFLAGRPAVRRSVAGFAAAGMGLALVIAFYAAPMDLLRMSSGVYRFGIFLDPTRSKVDFYRDGKTATISVVDAGRLRSIATNGKADASIARDANGRASTDESTMLLAAVLPLAMKPDAEEIANIGFGSGLTTHSLLGSPRVKRVDTIEIERMMVEGARFFLPRNERAYDDPRSHLHIEDAKTYFASEGRKYDIITSEPSNPWVSGVSTLFSREFYAHVKRYLKPDGIFVQWIQTYEIDLDLLSTVFRALGLEFGDYAAFRTNTDLLIVATPGSKLPRLDGAIFSFPMLKADMAYLGFRDVDDLRALELGDRAVLEPFFASTGYPPNSDYFPILDQQAPRARFREQDLHGMRQLRDGLPPVLPLLAGAIRTPVARLRGVGVNHPERIDDLGLASEAMDVALNGEPDRAADLPPQTRDAALVVNRGLSGCHGGGAAWTDALTIVASASLPFVARSDAEPLLKAAGDSACRKSLDERDAHRFALLVAINDGDAQAILANSTHLLAHSAAGDGHTMIYYLISGIAAGLAAGQIAEADALRDAYLPKLPPDARQDLQLRMVLTRLAVADRRK